MSELADLRLLVGAPWVAALAILLAPPRLSRALAIAGAVLVLAALAACAGGAAAIDAAWLGRGVRLALAVDPLAVPGLAVAALSGLLAVVEEERATRGRLAGLLALQGVVLAALLAQDVVALAGAWALAPALVLVSLTRSGVSHMSSGTYESEAAARSAGRAHALQLGLGAAALVLAGAGLAVGHRAATAGAGSAAIADLVAVRLPLAAALPLAGALALAGGLALGLWPLHAGLAEGTAAGSRGAARMLAGPARWLGLDALIRLWAPLAPLGAAALAPGLAGLALAGALYASLTARALVDPERRAARVALVLWSLAALGVATLAHEGVCGALVLGLVAALGLPGCGRAGPIVRAAIVLAGALGGVLVVLAALRFADLTLGAFAPWCAAGAALALGLAGSAMVHGTGSIEHAREDRNNRTLPVGHALAVGVAGALLIGLVARPAALLGRIGAAGEAWVHAVALQRCLALHEPRPSPAPLPAIRPTRCESPLGGLRAELAVAQEGRRGGD